MYTEYRQIISRLIQEGIEQGELRKDKEKIMLGRRNHVLKSFMMFVCILFIFSSKFALAVDPNKLVKEA
ncbi:MAG: hypothetical protein ACFFG0_48170, partial [Candidatus Thorarchaeota archaeon]